MGSNIFSLYTVSILVIILFFLVILNIAMIVFFVLQYRKDTKKYNNIWSKFNNKDLEDDIQKLIDNMSKTEKECQSSKILCSEINGKMTKCVQKLGFVKYDAYESANNGLSFAIALLDNDDNGILLDSVYNRNYSNIYAKEVVNGEVKGNISEEEKEALKKALNDKSFM